MRTNKIKPMTLADGTTVYICEANKEKSKELYARMIAKRILNKLLKSNGETEYKEDIQKV